MAALKLTVLPEAFCVVKLPAGSPFPPWSLDPTLRPFVSLSRSDDEASIIAPCRVVPAELRGVATFDMRALRVEGPLAFDAIGILASLSGVLAKAGVWILAISTYDTDYLCVKAGQVQAAVNALRAAGHVVDDMSVVGLSEPDHIS